MSTTLPVLDLNRYIAHVRAQPGQNWHAIAFQTIQDWAASLQIPSTATAASTTTSSTTAKTSSASVTPTPTPSGLSGSGVMPHITTWGGSQILTYSGCLADATGYLSLAGAPINNSDATGYVSCYSTPSWVNTNNEMRVGSFTGTYTRNETADGDIANLGWDQIGIDAALVMSNMAMPADGIVSTSGTAVTLTSGTSFTSALVGHFIFINGLPYSVASFTSGTSITLSSSAGSQSGVLYSAYSISSNTALRGVPRSFQAELYFEEPASQTQPYYTAYPLHSYIASLVWASPRFSSPGWWGVEAGQPNWYISGAWQANTTYYIGTFISVTISGTQYYFEASLIGGSSTPSTGGMSGATAPDWASAPAFGDTVTDGTGSTQITWENQGTLPTPLWTIGNPDLFSYSLGFAPGSYAYYVSPLWDSTSVLDPRTVAAMKISTDVNGTSDPYYMNYGRIQWGTAQITEDVNGILHLGGNGYLNGDASDPYICVFDQVPPSWLANFAYSATTVILDPNFNRQESSGGTSGYKIPTFNATVGGTTSDGSITWTNLGQPTQSGITLGGIYSGAGVALPATGSSGLGAPASGILLYGYEPLASNYYLYLRSQSTAAMGLSPEDVSQPLTGSGYPLNALTIFNPGSPATEKNIAVFANASGSGSSPAAQASVTIGGAFNGAGTIFNGTVLGNPGLGYVALYYDAAGSGGAGLYYNIGASSGGGAIVGPLGAGGTIGGSGTADYLARFTASTSIGDSNMYDDGSHTIQIIGYGGTQDIVSFASALNTQVAAVTYNGVFIGAAFTSSCYSSFLGNPNSEYIEIYGYQATLGTSVPYAVIQDQFGNQLLLGNGSIYNPASYVTVEGSGSGLICSFNNGSGQQAAVNTGGAFLGTAVSLSQQSSELGNPASGITAFSFKDTGLAGGDSVLVLRNESSSEPTGIFDPDSYIVIAAKGASGILCSFGTGTISGGSTSITQQCAISAGGVGFFNWITGVNQGSVPGNPTSGTASLYFYGGQLYYNYAGTITGPLTTSSLSGGTADQLVRWTGSSSVGVSNFYDAGSGTLAAKSYGSGTILSFENSSGSQEASITDGGAFFGSAVSLAQQSSELGNPSSGVTIFSYKDTGLAGGDSVLTLRSESSSEPTGIYDPDSYIIVAAKGAGGILCSFATGSISGGSTDLTQQAAISTGGVGFFNWITGVNQGSVPGNPASGTASLYFYGGQLYYNYAGTITGPITGGGGITGSGTTDYLTRWTTGGSVIGNANVYDDGSDPIQIISHGGDIVHFSSSLGSPQATVTNGGAFTGQGIECSNYNLGAPGSGVSYCGYDNLAYVNSAAGWSGPLVASVSTSYYRVAGGVAQFSSGQVTVSTGLNSIVSAVATCYGTPDAVSVLSSSGGSVVFQDNTGVGSAYFFWLAIGT